MCKAQGCIIIYYMYPLYPLIMNYDNFYKLHCHKKVLPDYNQCLNLN